MEKQNEEKDALKGIILVTILEALGLFFLSTVSYISLFKLENFSCNFK